MMRATEKRKTVIAATAITTLLSATTAFAAIKTAKKAGASNDDFTRVENVEFTTVPSSSKTAMTRLKKTLFKEASKQIKRAVTAKGDSTREGNCEFITDQDGLVKRVHLSRLK